MELNIQAEKKSLADSRPSIRSAKKKRAKKLRKKAGIKFSRHLNLVRRNGRGEVTAVKIEHRRVQAAYGSYRGAEKTIQTKVLNLEQEVSSGIHEEEKRESPRKTLIPQVERQQ